MSLAEGAALLVVAALVVWGAGFRFRLPGNGKPTDRDPPPPVA